MTPAVILFALLGFGLGLVYFTLLRRSLAGPLSPARVAVHAVLRLGLAAAVLVFAARAGAWPLLATFAGFLAARVLATRQIRKAP